MKDKILEKADIILFDLDGVITSEENYWICAAMTVAHFMGVDAEASEEIKDKVLVGGKALKYLKNLGINTNWDLGFVIYQLAEIFGLKAFEDSTFTAVLDKLKALQFKDIFEVYDYIKGKTGNGREDALWEEMREYFDKLYYEKLIHNESFVLPKESILKTLKKLSETKALGIGTGRLVYDMKIALDALGGAEYFDKNRIITYDDVLSAQERYNVTGLTKPNPFVFLKGALGKDKDDSAIAESFTAISMDNVLVVGDAGSDILAAKNCNAMSCAVLTGASDRVYFEKIGADLILNDITELA